MWAWVHLDRRVAPSESPSTRSRPSRAEPSRAEPGRAGQGRAGQGRAGPGRAGQGIFIGDGAEWVWENSGPTFSGTVEILDFYDASEHVGQLAKAFYEEDPAGAASCRERWCHDMKQTSPASLLTEARAMIESHYEWSEARRDAIEAEINYLQSRASRTRYGECRAKGWFIGSGVIEAGCKTVVGRRLKKSGMFWSETGVENILGLRCLVLGPHSNDAWKERRKPCRPAEGQGREMVD